MPSKPYPLMTVQQHILEEQRRRFPQATGEFSWLLSGITLATKVIDANVRRAGLADILGGMGAENCQGELVQKLDVLANDALHQCLGSRGSVAIMVSEEDVDPIVMERDLGHGKYIVIFDPLDGSSNIDVNVSIGTIFSIHRKVSRGRNGCLEDCLQVGSRQLAAGYVVYGSSTMLVYTSGAGVHGFTLDPSIGEFLLSHPNIQIPDGSSGTYSVNESYYDRWKPGQQRFMDELKAKGTLSTRYIGSLVADVHRTLLKGGIFMYPADRRSPRGKLRLLYEAAPLAFIMREAGGGANDGRSDILDLKPTALHQRTPLYIGSKALVERARELVSQDSEF